MRSLEFSEEEGKVSAMIEEGASFKDVAALLGSSDSGVRGVYRRAKEKLEVQSRIEGYLKENKPLEAARKELLFLVPQSRRVFSRFGEMKDVLLVPRGELIRRTPFLGLKIMGRIEKILSQPQYGLHLEMTEEEIKERGL